MEEISVRNKLASQTLRTVLVSIYWLCQNDVLKKLTSEVATSNTTVVHLFLKRHFDMTNMDTNTVRNVWEASLLHYNKYKTIYYIITQLQLTIGLVQFKLKLALWF